VEHYRSALNLVTEKSALCIALARSLSHLDEWHSVADALMYLPMDSRAPVVTAKDYNWAGPLSLKLIDHGHFEAARRLLTQLIAAHPERYEAWSILGIGLTKAESWMEAVGFLERALSINPSHTFSEWLLTRCYLKLGWLTKAKDHLLILTARPDAPIESFQSLAELALAQGSVSEAIKWFEKAIQRSPTDEKLHLRLIETCLTAGLLDEAEAYINTARSLVADPVWILATKSRIYISEGKTDDALRFARQLENLFPNHPAPCLAQINLLIDCGEFHRAKSLLDEGEIKHSGNASDQFLHARVRFHAVQFEFDIAERVINESADQNSINVLSLRLTNAINRGFIREARRLSRQLDDQLDIGTRTHALKNGFHRFMQGLLQEFTCNGFALDRLEEILIQPIEDRARQLCDAIKEEPGYLGFPVTLLRTFRQLGILEKHSPEGNVVIPATIIQFWDTLDIPEDVCTLMQSWIELNPQMSYQCFHDLTAQEFMSAHYGEQMVRAYLSCRIPALKADLFRLAYLFQCGGIYVDCDDKCQTDLTPLLKPGFNLILQQEIWATVGNNFIAVTPRHPFIQKALTLITSLILERQGDNIWFLSGPGMFTKAFCDTYFTQLSQGVLPSGTKVLLPYELTPFIAQHLPRRYKADGRHWQQKNTNSPLIDLMV
jgi:tetratricopeptide (TPR) repeat protein